MNPIQKHHQQVTQVGHELLDLNQRINDIAVKAVVTMAHQQGTSPHAIADHTGLTLGQVRNILNIPH